MKVPSPRPYQDHGIELLRQAMRDGFTRILFWLATGGGKSVIFLNLIAPLLQKNKKVLFLVKRRQLVFQTQKHLNKCGIKCSIMIGNSKGFDPSLPMQVASIDTITKRDTEFLKGFDFVISDECHDGTSGLYRTFLDKCKDEYGIKNFIGLTATPFPIGKKVHDFYQCVVKPIEMHQLRNQGYLVPVSLYHPKGVDLTDMAVDHKTGDYKVKQLSKKMRDLVVVGDAVQLYKTHGENKTGLCFCVDVEHSMTMCLEFNKAGIPAVHADADTPQDERDAAILNLQKAQREKKPFIICNVNIFSTGVDIPEAEVGIMSRPTMSEVLYIQQVGRLLRPCRVCAKCGSQNDNSEKCYTCGYDKFSYEKKYAIILDQGDNTERFGHPYDVRYAAIKQEDLILRKNKPRSLIKTCAQCFFVYHASGDKCPMCGHISSQERFHTTLDGELRPYDEYEVMKNYFDKLELEQRLNNFKTSWVAVQMYKKFGDALMTYKKDFDIPSWVPDSIRRQKEEELSGKVYR